MDNDSRAYNSGNRFLDTVVRILDEVDPESILHMARVAAGWDVAEEYEPEAKMLIARTDGWSDESAVLRDVVDVFSQMFVHTAPDEIELSGLIHFYRAAARRVWIAWLRQNDRPVPELPDIELPPHRDPVIISVKA